MRPIASLWAQCHVVSNIDLFLKTLCIQKIPLYLQQEVMDVRLLKPSVYLYLYVVLCAVHKHPTK